MTVIKNIQDELHEWKLKAGALKKANNLIPTEKQGLEKATEAEKIAKKDLKDLKIPNLENIFSFMNDMLSGSYNKSVTVNKYAQFASYPAANMTLPVKTLCKAWLKPDTVFLPSDQVKILYGNPSYDNEGGTAYYEEHNLFGYEREFSGRTLYPHHPLNHVDYAGDIITAMREPSATAAKDFAKTQNETLKPLATLYAKYFHTNKPFCEGMGFNTILRAKEEYSSWKELSDKLAEAKEDVARYTNSIQSCLKTIKDLTALGIEARISELMGQIQSQQSTFDKAMAGLVDNDQKPLQHG